MIHPKEGGCIEYNILPTRLFILMNVKVPHHNCANNILPEDELSGSKHVEYVKN
jgi:hypothetical protein